MKNNTTNLMSTVAVLTAAALVVGVTFAIVAAATQQSTFAAVPQKKPGHDDKKDKARDNNGNGNGNTVTTEECKNRGSASGFDTALDQECENLICTHPGENATCSQEGVVTPTAKPTTTTLLVKKVCEKFQIPPPQPPCLRPSEHPFSIQITTGNNPQPSTFILTPDSSQLVTLGPGTFTIVESAAFPISSATFSGDCTQTGAFAATGTISVGQHLTCTITNTITQD